ncbi:tRNA glutamyl-Q(34) synthetase GluQRS [Sphingosinicella sp. LHD-64]|uniref:tRNA glutamyl-Q(34) synthetase GluQRS n=1 Tax=Sphingosinicella sp. LHD-64 TaxID=3072139 RepID=UPI0028104590|nr:tRNA glutamyl-Q(34) synthetase GluQRS [Sphingosinicella sp. LHD-64]MDQ8755836.1 tRNA glutamyl-Q(34) synthetase GluQRS [Sphingosinicella sp. LHD-64]
MHPVTRFAPSPTGRLHLGHAFSALAAHDFARERDGTFLLRIEDIDPGRSRLEHVDAILEDLIWLGLEWDGEMIYQSERLDLYAAALDQLKAAGLVYPCFCTRADIAASVAAPHGPDGPVYPGTCRGLVDRDLSRPHAWRLDMTKALPVFSRGRGSMPNWMDDDKEIIATPEAFGDIVLARKDAPASYHLAVTVDDAAQGVTDIVRGQDLFAATHVHRLLQALLDLPTPRYHHHGLLTGADGSRLAKRHGAPTIASLREAGADPAALVAAMRRGEYPAGYSLVEAEGPDP